MANWQQCSNCYFFEADRRICRRHAPRGHIEWESKENVAHPNEFLRTLWPPVNRTDWCGDYMESPEK